MGSPTIVPNKIYDLNSKCFMKQILNNKIKIQLENYDEFIRAKRVYDRAPSGTTDMSLLNLVNEAINNTEEEEEEEDPVIRENRNKEFLIACGKYEKGGKGANLTKAQSLYNSMNSIDIEYTDEDGWSI